MLYGWRERERGREREEEGKKTKFIGFSKYPCTRRVEPDASISLENPLPLYLSIYLSVTSVSPSPLPHPASYFRPSAPFSGFCAFPSPSPLRFSFSFFPLSLSLSTIGFDAFESRKASSNLCRSRWRGGIWKVSSIYSHGRNDREGKIRERERRIDPTMDQDGRKWRDFGGWLKTCERKSRGKEGRKEGRIVCWSFAILIHDYRSSCLLSRESALSLSLSLFSGAFFHPFRDALSSFLPFVAIHYPRDSSILHLLHQTSRIVSTLDTFVHSCWRVRFDVEWESAWSKIGADFSFKKKLRFDGI